MRPIDADALVEAIEELKKSPWYNGENGNFERIVRSDAIGIIEDLCVKDAPTLDYAPKWISVKDRLPKNHEEVLACTDDGCMDVLWLGDAMGVLFWEDNNFVCYPKDYVAYWMPLPEAPKEENK